MQAIEFDAAVTDGVIKIPESAKLKRQDRAHVIVLFQDAD